jgi:hypothetical protein
MRRATDFCLPNVYNIHRPIIMVGPGTGVAPFRGFLQHRRAQAEGFESGGTCVGLWRGLEIDEKDEDDVEEAKNGDPAFVKRWGHASQPKLKPKSKAKKQQQQRNATLLSGTNATLVKDGNCELKPAVPDLSEEPCDPVDSGDEIGPMVLFFGCRHRDHDYLYKDDFESFANDGTLTALHTAFSREQDKKVYVQHRIREQGPEVAELILKKQAFFFVCGDGSRMMRDVQQTLEEVLAKHGSLSKKDAEAYVAAMKREKPPRYVTDIWS